MDGRASGRGRSLCRAHKASTYHQTRLKATHARLERGREACLGALPGVPERARESGPFICEIA